MHSDFVIGCEFEVRLKKENQEKGKLRCEYDTMGFHWTEVKCQIDSCCHHVLEKLCSHRATGQMSTRTLDPGAYLSSGRFPRMRSGSAGNTAKGEKSASLRTNLPPAESSHHHPASAKTPLSIGWLWVPRFAPTTSLAPPPAPRPQTPSVTGFLCAWDPLLWNASALLLPLAEPVTQRKSSSASN